MKNYLLPGNLKKECKAVIIVLGFIFSGSVCWGNTIEDQDDLFSGFDEQTITSELPGTSEGPKSPLLNHFSGYTKLFAVANTTHYSPGEKYRDWYGLSGLRLEAVLEADFRILNWKVFSSLKGFYDFSYSINGREEYTSEVLDAYEKELDLREAYIQGTLTNYLDLKIGRQIVVWGRSDNFRVTDVLNPLDNRDPGIEDFENVRLPLTMFKTDIYFGNWNLDLISIHEHRYDKNPPYGHFLYPYAEPAPSDELPANTLENTELALELAGAFSGWDISFYGAHLFNDRATITPTDPPSLEHHKITMAGASLSAAWGNMLYIAEFAHFRNIRFKSDYDKDYNRNDFLIGVEYSGFSDTLISLDYASRHIQDYDSILDSSPENPQSNENNIGCRITSDFIQDTLQLTALFILTGEWGDEGAMQRFTARYNIADNWSVTSGVWLFQAGSSERLQTADDTGRIFVELRYDF